ncbi:MAG: hypothetical protein AB1405_02345 [Bdellovibrionota bacterium]
MTQIPQISQISGELAGAVREPPLQDVFGQIRTVPEKTMIFLITLPPKVATKKTLANLATFIAWVVSAGFTRVPRISGRWPDGLLAASKKTMIALITLNAPSFLTRCVVLCYQRVYKQNVV